MKRLKQISNIFKKVRGMVCFTICVLILTSCDDRVGGRFTNPPPPSKYQPKVQSFEKLTLYDYLTTTPNYKTMLDYVETDPELKELLKGEKKHTLFAVSDLLFSDLSEKSDFALDVTKVHFKYFREIIHYNIAEGVISLDQVKKGLKITTLQGEVVQFSPGGTINIDKNTQIMISGNVLKYKNGMIYTLDQVLLPPSIRKFRHASDETIAWDILWDKKYTGLFRIIGIADKNVPKENKIATLLANKSAKLTLFAVSDKMFSIDINKLKPKPTLSKYISDNFSTPEDARKFVKRHILESRVIEGEELEKFPNHYKITMMSGDKIKIIKAKRPFPPSNPHGIRLAIDGSQNLEKSGVVHAMGGARSGRSENGVLHKCTMIQKE